MNRARLSDAMLAFSVTPRGHDADVTARDRFQRDISRDREKECRLIRVLCGL